MHMQERPKKTGLSTPIAAAIMIVGAVLTVILLLRAPKPLFYDPNLTEQQTEKSLSTINLRVTGKRIISYGGYGFYRSYFVALSNGMDVGVTKAEYESYNINESYDFVVEETRIIYRKMLTKAAANP